MTPENAIRFLAFEAEWCRSHAEHEAFCLLLPALLRALNLTPMLESQASAFKHELRESVNQQPKQNAPLERRG